MTDQKATTGASSENGARTKVSIEEDAEFILRQAGIKHPDEDTIAEAVSIMERALEDAIEEGTISIEFND